MPKSPNQKIKLLYLMQILLEQTDEQHPLSTSDLIHELARLDIHAERKTIYDDIETLRHFGLDILNRKGEKGGYYIASRQFELPELKLLVDTVQASRFITAKKSAELIQKLGTLTSHHEARRLQRQVTVTGRIKTMNESIYYNVDHIHEAIQANVQIRFQYFEWTPAKKQQLRHDGAYYQISPWALTWDDENYYMIGYDSEAGQTKHYRVDKMLRICLTQIPREGKGPMADLNLADFSRQTFGMFAGEEQQLTIRFENHLAGVVIDRFGKDIVMHPDDATHFVAHLQITVSNQFFGWLAGLGPGVRIVSPESAATAYQAYLQALLSDYQSHLS